MSTAATNIKIPQALTADEVKDGITAFMRIQGVPAEVCEQVRIGLNKTCMLNHQSYSKFKANWIIGEGKWWVNFTLDDYGRESVGGIGGVLEDTELESVGTIDAMPPDAFRRRTEQPIPQPRTVAPKKDDGVGITMARKGRGARKMA